MRLLDSYILKSIIVIFVTCLFVFCFLYVLIDLASNLAEIIERQVPLATLWEYYSSFLPIILVETSTVACLLATIFTFSRLNHNNEIIVLRTCGLGFLNITKSTLCFGILVSIFIFWLNEQFVPQASVSSQIIREENISVQTDAADAPKKKRLPEIRNLTFYGLKNRLYFADSFNPNNYELQGITIIGQDNNQNVQEKIVALKGAWTGIAWKFYNCHITLFNPSQLATPSQIKYFPEKLMDIKETPQDFIKQRLNVRAMNSRQLYEYIQRFSHSGATKALNSLKIDLHQKIALPWGNLVLILVGIPLAMTTSRRKAFSFTSLGVAIMIGFLFYVVNAVCLALGKGGLVAPVLSAWLAPLIFGGAGMYLIKTRF